MKDLCQLPTKVRNGPALLGSGQSPARPGLSEVFVFDFQLLKCQTHDSYYCLKVNFVATISRSC